jgi:hypothetical protein
MLKFFKPIRGHRGYFSYMTESVVNMLNVLLIYPNEEFKVYHDLSNIDGYGSHNIYDVCFIQDKNDYFLNKNEYSNIELVNNIAQAPRNTYCIETHVNIVSAIKIDNCKQ